MAGLRFTVPFTVTTATSTVTVVQLIAATNTRIRIERIVITGKGVLNTDAPCQFELLLQTTAGTMTAITPVKQNSGDSETIQTTANQTFTAEPTASTIKQAFAVHPQSRCDQVYPPGRDLIVVGGTRLGLRINTPAQASTFVGYIECEE